MGAIPSLGVTREQAFADCLKTGTYSTRGMKHSEAGRWSTKSLSMLGDFLSMREDHDTYFLCGRKIFGIGRLVGLEGQPCAIGNFPGRLLPRHSSLLRSARATGARRRCEPVNGRSLDVYIRSFTEFLR